MYQCKNEGCRKYNVEQNPGGRITYRDGLSSFSGSNCRYCGQEMMFISKEPARFVIINPGDARNK